MKRILAVVAVLCLFASACGNDDSPADGPATTEAPAPAPEPTEAPEPAATPEPTAAPEPAATPEPTAAPEPAATPEPTAAPEPTEAPEPAESMDTLAFGGDTTGGDVAERLSNAERDCAQEALGSDYELLEVTPLGSLREIDVETALLGCLTHDNLILVGTAIVDQRFGGWTPETSECVLEVYHSIPSVLYRNFGIEWDGPTPPPEAVTDTTRALYQCMNPVERTRWMLGLWNRMATTASDLSRDYVEMLTPNELACATEAVGEEVSEELLDQSPIQVWRAYPATHDCFSPGTMGNMFARFTANQIGGVADSSLQCMADFTAQRPDFIFAIANGPFSESFQENVDVIQFARDVFAFYGCLDTDERGRLQDAFLGGNRVE